MLEIFIVLALVGGLLLLLGLPTWVGFTQLVMTALGLMAVGLVGGCLAGLIYHIRLFRLLGERGVAATRWWVNPRPLHKHFPTPIRRQMDLLFAMGATGLGLAFLGSALFFSASLVP